MKSVGIPLTVIQRVDSVCTGCKKCDRACPMAIDVSTADKVRDMDCHLCTDCIQACPEKGALTINRKNIQWFPSVAAIGLIAAGMWLGNTLQIPTITEKWGSEEAFSRAKVYQQSGLRSIKCYGSSSSFASHMREVEGVLGVQTFVGSHSVTIWSDPSVIDEHGVREAMFSANRLRFSEPAQDTRQIGVVTIGVDKLFDSYDYFDFEQLLAQHQGLYLADSKFGEPVQVTFYFDPTVTTPEKIVSWIESPTVTYKQGEGTVTQDCEFRASILEAASSITAIEYRRAMFESADWKFNGFAEDAVYESFSVSMPQLLEPEYSEQLPFLISHISNDKGTVRYYTEYTGDAPFAHSLYKKDITSPENIYTALNALQLRVSYDDGSEEYLPNPFRFERNTGASGNTTK